MTEDWIHFPLTAALNAFQIGWDINDGIVLSFGLIFLIVIGIAVCLLLIKQYLLSLIILCTALVILYLIPLYFGFLNAGWLRAYLEQSQDKVELYYFTKQYYLLNINTEPTFKPIPQYEYLLDRLKVSLSMLGSGWYTAFIANLALIGIGLKYSEFQFKLFLVLTFSFSFFAFQAFPVIKNLMQAETSQHNGNQYLVKGQPRKAILYYKKALKMNPALSFSTPFLLKVSEAYYMGTDNQNSLGKIFEAWMFIQEKNLFKYQAGKPKYYRIARTLIEESGSVEPPLTPLNQALFDLRDRFSSKLWKYQGLAEYAAGNLNGALSALLNAFARDDGLTTRFYLASVYLKLDYPQPVIDLLRSYAETITHSAVKADIYCTVGDAYIKANEPEYAREEYRRCIRYDNLKNHRVIQALSGY